MKKIVLCISVFVVGLFTSGCGNTKTLKCTMQENDMDGMKMSQAMAVTFKNDTMTKIDLSMDMVIGEEYLSYMDMDTISSSLESEYAELKEINGISIKTNVKDNKVTMNMVADLNKMSDEDKEEFDFAGSAKTYEDAKKYFESEGYTCK